MTTGRRSGDTKESQVINKAPVKKQGETKTAKPDEKTALEGIPGKKGTGQGKYTGPVTIDPGDEHPDPGEKAGRPVWSGNLTIGLVNIPVRLHTMVRDRSFSFRLLHRKDGQPLRYDRVCTRDGQIVPWHDTVKGYEVRKGEFIVIEPAELKAFLPESDKKIRIEKFVHYLSLDPVYFETPYILTPDGSEEAYSLLLTALQELGQAAVGTITLRTKEYPAVVHVYRGGLVLTTLRYADEVTGPNAFEILTGLPEPKEAELALAKRIIEDLSGDFLISDFHDTYRKAVETLVKQKIAGEKIVYEIPHPGEARELMDALKETIVALSKK